MALQKTTLQKTTLGKTVADQRANMRARVKDHQKDKVRAPRPQVARALTTPPPTGVSAGVSQAQFDALHAKFDALSKLLETVVESLEPVLEVANFQKGQLDAAKAAAGQAIQAEADKINSGI